MTEAVPSMRFAQKSVLITGAAAGKGASRMGGEADEPVRPATGSRGGDALSLQRGRDRNDRSSLPVSEPTRPTVESREESFQSTR
jgi:hypothetical protein